MDQKDLDSVKSSDHFPIEAILTPKQAYALQKKGEIPEWMVQDMEKDDEKKEGGVEFDYSEDKKEGDLEDEDIDDL